MVKTNTQTKTKPNTQSDPETKEAAVFSAKESKLEKALRLGNDQVIAKAVQDILKRDHTQVH